MNEERFNVMFGAFKSLIRAYNEYVTAAVNDYDLSPNEIAVLSQLNNVTSASQIASETNVSKALVSRSVKNLKNKGLIDVRISSFDKREQDLSLTESGRSVAERIGAANDRFCAKVYRGADGEPLEITQLVLEIMLRNLGVEEKSNDASSQ